MVSFPDQRTKMSQPPQSGQDVKVEFGTEASHGRDMEVNVRIECLLTRIYTERYACTKNHTKKVIKT